MACQPTSVHCSTSGRSLLGSNTSLPSAPRRHNRIVPASFHQQRKCLCKQVLATASNCTHSTGQLRRHRQRLEPLATYPEPETEKERSSVDFPQEWITPQPSRRPDPLPEFERLETPPPRRMPGDPEQPDEEEEEEKEKEKPDEEPEEQPEEAPSEE